MGTVIVVNETQDEKRIPLRVEIANLVEMQAADEGSTPGESLAATAPADAGDGSPALPAEAGWWKRVQTSFQRSEHKTRTRAGQREGSALASGPAPVEGHVSPDRSHALIIAAGGGIKISEEQLRLYDYEPMVQRGDIAIIAVEEPEDVSAYSLVTNKTARRIGIKNEEAGSKDKLIIPAFGTRRMPRSKLEGYGYKAWEKFNLIDVSEDVEENEEAPTPWAFIIASMVAVYGYPFVYVFGDGIRGWSIWPDAWSVWWSPLVVALAIGLFGSLTEFFVRYLMSEQGKAVRTAFGRSLNLLVLLLLGPIGLPVLVILFFGGVLSGLQGVDLMNPDVGLLMRLVQLLLIVLLSALPGLLYFQFERRQERALRNRFIRDIMLLNPWVHTEDDAEIMYGSMVDRVSSTIGANTRQFTIFASGLPILLATLLVTAGWIFTLWPVGPIGEGMSIYALLTPYPTAIIFAFLGAYFFTLNLIFRRYTRGDLTPKAYSHIVVRILSSIIVVWAVSVFFAASGEENGFGPEIDAVQESAAELETRIDALRQWEAAWTNQSAALAASRAAWAESLATSIQRLAFTATRTSAAATRLHAAVGRRAATSRQFADLGNALTGSQASLAATIDRLSARGDAPTSASDPGPAWTALSDSLSTYLAGMNALTTAARDLADEESSSSSGADGWFLLVFAFGIGIWPETGIALLKDSLRQRKHLNNVFPSLSVAHPITELEGISLYDRARLLEEGIDSVETLAHHNLIELMLQSGIPTPRLVDLVDQAILYLHVTGVVRESSDGERARGIHVLRDAGIRNATDLLRVVAALDDRLEKAKMRRKEKEKAVREATRERKRFFEMLDPEPAFGTAKHRMQMVLDALQDDEYLEYVKNWRLLSSSQEIISDPEHFYED